jgi:hypothetical protein
MMMKESVDSVYWGRLGYWQEFTERGLLPVDGQAAFRKGEATRCTIAGANGALTLTVPVEKPSRMNCPICDIRVSEHGRWRHRHWQAFVSAYRRSPYFDYYVEDFAPFYQPPKSPQFLLDLNEGIRRTVSRLIGLDSLHPSSSPPQAVHYMEQQGLLQREIETGRQAQPAQGKENVAPYYQVFAYRQGFISGLSVADLLFNEGPETLAILRKHVFPV